jgi:hypothetical protein
MKRTIHYTRTVGANEGMPDYSSKTMGAEVELDENVTIEGGLVTLQYSVDKALGLVKEEEPTKTTKKKASKKKASKKKTKKKVAKKPVEVDENGEEWYDDSEKPSDSPVVEEEVVEEEPKKKVTKKKTTRKKKPTAIAYDNTIDKHKKLIGDLTAEILGKDWTKDSDKKAKVRSSAREMIGKDFIDKEGEVTKEFKEEYSKLLKD